MRSARAAVVHALIVATVLGGADFVSSVSAAAPIEVPPVPSASFDELKAQAAERRTAGDHAQAARLLAAAYDSLEDSKQIGLKGEVTVNSAVKDFRLAQEQDPENLALYEDEAALLERFQAHPQRQGSMLPELVQELERVEAKIEELRRVQEVAAEAARQEAREEADRVADVEKEPRIVEESDASTEEEPRSNRKADAAILGVGLVSVLGGTALIANGVWGLGHVNGRADELLVVVDASSGGTDEMRDALRRDIEEWRRTWRGIDTGLVIGGAVLAATGIGLTTWGSLRLRKGNGRQRSGQVSVVQPMISVHGIGISVAGRY
jgi:hypothetical protein